ncbi:hypothetical protein [Spirulina sp. 06S082]|uniref:hypothetical protein n=1 Tax=Spirulina sp. 06S082 TaxID=3110248 RepID=UPI002B214BDE|nr:hypothetical protein [Spirulina sp. 06S082]MEA5469574.1 hypothetical protein [Spirulina sp. 06S082]
MIKPVKPVELFLALGLTIAVSACGGSPVDESGEAGDSPDAPTETPANESSEETPDNESSEETPDNESSEETPDSEGGEDGEGG